LVLLTTDVKNERLYVHIAPTKTRRLP
jgi:hypothetical protein